MGGFVLDISRIHDLHGKMTITHHGVLKLARNGLFLPISEESISDKSKADLLAKGLVICQVGWLAAQCIARKVQGLPISLLEIHTLVHVFCAVTMYLIWLSKPLDINNPTRTDAWIWNGSEGQRLNWEKCIANMLMLSTHLKSWSSSDKFIETSCAEMDFALDLDCKKVVLQEPRSVGNTRLNVFQHDISQIQSKLDDATYKLQTIRRAGTAKSKQGTLSIITGESIESNVGPALVQSQREGQIERYSRLELLFSEKAVKRWVLGLNGSSSIQTLTDGKIYRSTAESEDQHPYFEPTITNFSSPSYEHGVLTTLCLWVLCVVYGGIHAIGWDFVFPSSIEQKCWRIACPLLVALGGPMSELIRYSIQVQKNQTRHDPEGNGYMEVVKFFSSFLAIISSPFYVVARIFLVAEAFVSLRQVPSGVYASVSWARFIPHI